IMKIIVDYKRNRLLGIHMIGSYASEIIYGAAMMIGREMRIDDIKKLVFPHPSVSEVLREMMFL
ncbi:MAG TPA: dihydrolipoyl dehydrogenase, partial [Clostridiales bacterium]|nr:dihydrolipoyl dehydrogenase [Clostridiales bacterium]